MLEHSIATTTHGRYLTVPAASYGDNAPLLVGFHGYAEDAETQLLRLRAIPGSDRWHLLSIQGLHRFYQRRTNQVVAGWMTSQDRELAIADNIAYVNACITAVCPSPPAIVFAGFSQGVAMAFRAAVNAPANAHVIAVGGDIPPELDCASLRKISRVLIARGASDELYKNTQFEADQHRLHDSSVAVHSVILNAGHEWSADLVAAAADFLELTATQRYTG